MGRNMGRSHWGAGLGNGGIFASDFQRVCKEVIKKNGARGK